MNHQEEQYLNLARNILEYGEYKANRTGIGTYSQFGAQMRFNMNYGFPVITTKQIHLPSVIHELIWFKNGETNIKYLQDNGVRIWNEWADECGNLGPVYGKMWRAWPDYKIASIPDMAAGLEIPPDHYGYEYSANIVKYEEGEPYEDWALYYKPIDQLQNVIDKLRSNPNDRRLIVSAWNPGFLPFDDLDFSENVARNRQALPPCHAFYQFYHINGKLSLQIYQRSVDVFLGLPFNISSYALLLNMVAHITDLEPWDLVWTGGDCHIYENHIEQMQMQIARDPYGFPVLGLNPDCKEINDFNFNDVQIINYQHHEKLTGKVAK